MFMCGKVVGELNVRMNVFVARLMLQPLEGKVLQLSPLLYRV